MIATRGGARACHALIFTLACAVRGIGGDPQVQVLRETRLRVLHDRIAADYQVADLMLCQNAQQFSEVWAGQHVRT
jgi:hypothetical protein